MINVEVPAPYVSVELVALAIAEALGKPRPTGKSEEANVPADWQSELRELVEAGAIPCYDWETLLPKAQIAFDIRSDVVKAEDLNACTTLSELGLSFSVKAKDPREDLEFLAYLAETVNNEAPIDWQYWVNLMPTLSTGEAARLMAGLDPDLYPDLERRPVPRNVDGACKKANDIERLANAEGVTRATADDWLKWAQGRNIKPHVGFVLALEDRQHQEAVNKPDQDNDATSVLTETDTGAWDVVSPQRFVGYRTPLYRLIVAAHRAGKPRPTAREVLEAWSKDRPAEIVRVLTDGFDYYDTKGDEKPANLEALRKAIVRMTNAR